MTSKEHDNSLANSLLASGSSCLYFSVCLVSDVNYFDRNTWICKSGRKNLSCQYCKSNVVRGHHSWLVDCNPSVKTCNLIKDNRPVQEIQFLQGRGQSKPAHLSSHHGILYSYKDEINVRIRFTIWLSNSAPSIWKWLVPSIRCVSTRPAAELSFFRSCLTLVNPSRVPITKSFGFGDLRIPLWCLPKRIEANMPKGYPILT